MAPSPWGEGPTTAELDLTSRSALLAAACLTVKLPSRSETAGANEKECSQRQWPQSPWHLGRRRTLVAGRRPRGETSGELASAPSARPSEGFLRPLKPRRPEPAQGSAQGLASAQALGFAPVSAQQIGQYGGVLNTLPGNALVLRAMPIEGYTVHAV